MTIINPQAVFFVLLICLGTGLVVVFVMLFRRSKKMAKEKCHSWSSRHETIFFDQRNRASYARRSGIGKIAAEIDADDLHSIFRAQEWLIRRLLLVALIFILIAVFVGDHIVGR